MAVESEQSKHICTAFSSALDLYTGRGRRVSVEDLADATGIAPQTIYAYRRGELTPSWPTALKLLGHLPGGFANMVLAPAGLSAHRVDDMDNDTHRVHAELAAVVALMADQLRDGRFDHREIAELEKRFPGLIEILMAWVTARKAEPTLRAVGDGE